MITTLRLATRGSVLARAQATSVRGMLVDRRLDVELIEVKTTGDQIQDEPIYRLGRAGMPVRVFDERVLNGEVDAAVHSMKGMSTERPADLVVIDAPECAPTDDVLVTVKGHDIDDLPEGAIVGTSSLRRQTQLLNCRDDLEAEPLRGNVDTRIEKLLVMYLQREHEARVENDKERQGKKGKIGYDETLDETADKWFEGLTELERQALGRWVETEYDAIIFVETGLKRSGFTEKVNYERLSWTTLVPAPG